MASDLLVNFTYRYATIASGAPLSSLVDVTGLIVVGIEMPTAWDAASITLQGTTQGQAGTLKNLFDEDNSEITWAGVAASKIHLALPASPLIGGLTHIKLRSGTSAVPVNQTAERVLTLICLVPNAD